MYSGYFEKGIKRFEDYYKKYLEPERKQEILEAIYNTCDNQQIFTETVSSIIETSRYFPTIRDIKNAYVAIKNSMIANGKLTFERKTDCLFCNGRGIVTVLKDGEDYAMACKCKAGESINLPRHKLQPLKYEPNIVLTEQENEVYVRLIRNPKILETVLNECPF